MGTDEESEVLNMNLYGLYEHLDDGNRQWQGNNYKGDRKMSIFNWKFIEVSKNQVFNQIQEEMKIWQAHNFPNRQSFEPLLGIGEELGELCNSDGEEGYLDAIGDICIYIADYCNSMNFNLQKIYTSGIQSMVALIDNDYRYTIALGMLNHHHLKLHQKIRINENHEERIQDLLNFILHSIGVWTNEFIEDIAWQTWLKVRERDWQANRNEAHKIAEEKK